MKKNIRIGAGAGYSGDRIEPAVLLAEKGDIRYLVFECLAERTIALAQLEKSKSPMAGFDPLLEDRFRACLPICHHKGIKIITNMGAANPLAAMYKVAGLAKESGLTGLRIAAVTGDDVYHLIKGKDYNLLETGDPLGSIDDKMISANAYLGVSPIVEALQNGADVVITGRVADPALFMAPLIYEFGWSITDYVLMGKATVLGHLLECAGQVTGGYFADPGLKEVSDLANLGFPIAEVSDNGEFFITKVSGTGGLVTTATCKEQLLYEIHDPKQYFTPDVVADFSNVRLVQKEIDQVLVVNGSGAPKTGKLKVSVGYHDSFIGEGQISYGGPGAVNRAQLALDIVKKRLGSARLCISEARYDIVGVNSLYGNQISQGEPFEVRARVAVRTSNMADAIKIGNEVETLYTNGPAGGGGVSKSSREVIAIQSILVDAKDVKTQIHYIEICQ